MLNRIRMRNSIIKHINQHEFSIFLSSITDEIKYRIKELNIEFKPVNNSTINFKITQKTKNFIDMLVKEKICKSHAESIRFLLFMFMLNGNTEVNINTINVNIKMIGGIS